MEEDDEVLKIRTLEARVDELRGTIRALGAEASKRLAALHELMTEVEQLRRENANLRADAALDLDHANNWRRYVALVGQKRAVMYLAKPDKKEDEH